MGMEAGLLYTSPDINITQVERSTCPETEEANRHT